MGVGYGFDIEKDSERRWVCRLCIERNRLKPGNVIAIGTQNAERHLWDHHKIQDPFGKRNVFQRLVVEWIVESNLSFREPENKRLRAIFEYLNPFVASADAHISHDTVRKRAVFEFEKHKEKVIEIIEILETYEIPDEKIGYFTLDNAPNNDTALDTIGERFKFCGKERRGRCFGHVINLVVKAILFGKDADAFESRLRHGDVLATAEHEFWRKKGPVGKLHNLVVAIHRSDVLTTLLGSIQRLEFDASEDPRVRIRKPLNVVVDNETRWLSQLYMIRKALRLRPYLETLVLKHKQEWEKDNLSKRSKRLKASAIMPAMCRDENKLNDKDWAVLGAFANILQSFEDAVKALEGDGIQRKRKQGYFESYGNVWDVIVGYEFLLAELEKAKAMVDQYPEPDHFRVNINLGWKKLDEYYNKLDETPIYYTSLALHPAYRWGYFETVWSGRPTW
ncbi:hypothetical protein S40293_10230, partial [Stachybotrys chartarum IBT 40293]